MNLCGSPEPTKLQEADARITELEDTVAELEEENDKLQAIVDDYHEALETIRDSVCADTAYSVLKLWP